jgi:hypothetical protein
MAEKRAASRCGRPRLLTARCVVNEDALDARLIREAREAEKGKTRVTVNELRTQRGLAAI